MGISFDKAGNRTSQTTYDYTIGTPGNETATESYNYTGDRLTQVGSVTYAYDAVGNPTTYNGYTLEWNGRKLMEMSMNVGQFLYTFAYNADGIRTVKTNGSTIHHYTLNGSQIVTETWTTKSSSGAETPTTSWYTSMMRTALPSGCSTETRVMPKMYSTPTTSRRICKGTLSPSTRKTEPR